MNKSFKQSERGSVNTKFVGFLICLGLAAHAFFNYLPVVYNAENLRQDVKAAVMQSAVVPPTSGTPADVTRRRVLNIARANDAPTDAFIEVKQVNGLVQARVAYNRKIALLPFGIYDYQYKFDYTANANGFTVE